MPQDLLRSGAGRFWRGNLHCHSDRSDGLRSPEEVAAAYRDAGYDFIVLSDHFEAEYGPIRPVGQALLEERMFLVPAG